MAERDTFVDVSDGDQLNEGYFNGIKRALLAFKASNLTPNSHTGDTNETELGSATVSANTINTGIIVMAAVRQTGFDGGPGSGVTGTFRLKIGDDGSEVTKQTITLSSSSDADINPGDKFGGMILWKNAERKRQNVIDIMNLED